MTSDLTPRRILTLLMTLLGLATGMETTGDLRLSLDGPWRFTTDQTRPVDQWDAITVPGNWDALPAYSTHTGKGWYQRQFSVPETWAGKRLRLCFGAVYHEALVSIDGVEVARHVGGYTPFEADITDRIIPGKAATLVVCADNTYRRGAWWAWGGISRSVAVVATGDARIVWQHIRSEPDLAAGTATVHVRYRLANAGATPCPATVEGAIDGVPGAIRAQATIPAQGTVEVDAQVTLPKEAVRLWHFDHPELYRLVSTLRSPAGLIHQASDRFGIRKIELVRDGLRLNGERVRLCGLNRVADSSATGATEPDALVRQDVRLMKQANANLSRLMHVPQAPNLLDLLDEQGMMIWAEIPVWGSNDPNIGNPASGLPEQWMREMIERDYNHPSIIGWSVGNELANHFRYVERMLAYTRSLDPHRMATHVSNTCFGATLDPAKDPTSISPISMPNTYGIGAASKIGLIRQRWPDQPVFFTEFGFSQFPSRINKLQELFDAATKDQPAVIGVSMWTFNDYRSDYRGTQSSGFRSWGLVDDARKPKEAYQQVRELFSPVHRLSRQGTRVEIVPRSPDEVPSFTLRGYRLAWDGGGMELPVMKPGDKPWSQEVAAPAGAAIRLMTPTGFDVASCQ